MSKRIKDKKERENKILSFLHVSRMWYNGLGRKGSGGNFYSIMARTINIIKRILLGIVFITLAAFISLYIKDMIDRQEPDHAVPQLIVTADGQKLNLYLSNYYWKFPFGNEAVKIEPEIDEGAVSVLDEGIVQANILHGGEQLKYTFSQQESLRYIDRSDAYSTVSFKNADNEKYAPNEPGAYYYKVAAEFERGRVEYYFRIDVVP